MPSFQATGLLIKSLSENIETIKNDLVIHQPHRVCISDETGNVTTSDVTVDELSILNQIKGDVQAEIDAYKEFVINTCNQIVNQLDSRMGVVESNLQNSFADVQLQSASVSLDDLQNTATRNVITNGFHYGNLKVDASTLEVQNLNTLGETAVIKSNTIRSSNFEIISESLQDAAVKIVQSGTLSQNSDFIDVRVNGDSKLVVKNSGMIGVNNSNPTKHLDVVGDVNFTGKINDVTVAELSQLSGSTDSLQTQINNVYSKIAAYTTDIDNHLSELKAPIAAQITSVTNTAIASIDTLKQDLMNIAIDTSNYLMNTKQDAIVFDDNFIYDAIGKTVSLNNKSVWVIDENEPSLRKGNIAVYENHVSKITFQEITTSNREYPPVNISGSGLDVSGFTSTIADQEYGNGDYKIYWSSSSTTGTGMHLFNNSNKYSFEQNTYDQGSGLYKGNKHLVKGYGGEWVVLEFPFQFLVSSVKIEGWDFFHQHIPKDFKVYGSDDNKNWNELGHFINPELPDEFPFYFVSNITTTEVPYKFIGLCFHKTHSATTILLNQIVFIGKEYAKIFHQYALETDLETKSDIVSGAASSVLSSDFNDIDKILISSIDGKITSSVDVSVLNNLLDVDSNIQLQIDTMNNNITVSSNEIYQKLYEIQSNSDIQVNTITTASLEGLQDKIAGVSGDGLNFDSNTNHMSFTGTIEVPALTQIVPNVWNSSASGEYISYSNINVYHDKITIKKEVEKQHPYVISNGLLVSDNNFVNTGECNYTYSFTTGNNNSITFSTDGLIDVLIVGGGGSGGSNLGGGGGGGTVFAAYQIPVKGKMEYPIIVGSGGRALYEEDGGDSSAFGIVALGGGAGGNDYRIDGRFNGTGGGGGVSADGTVYGLGGSNIYSNLSFSESAFGENSAIIGTEKYGGDGGGDGISETYFIENVVFGKGGQGSTSLTSGDGGGQVGNINGAPNTGGGGGGGALGMDGGDGGTGLVIVRWNMQPEINEHRLITDIDLSTKQNLLNFTSDFTHDTVNNIVSVATPQLWEDNISYISRGNVKIYNDRIKMGTGRAKYGFASYTTDMIAWYKFDGDFTDSSGNGYNITTYANTSFETNNNRSCVKTLSSANITLPTQIHPYNIWNNSSSGITFSTWFRVDSTTGYWGRLFDFQQSAETDLDIFVGIKTLTNHAFYIKCNGSIYTYGSSSVTTAGTPLDGNWHHFVWSIDKSGVWNVYYDGTNLNVNITKQLRENTTYAIRYLSDSAYSGDSSLIGNFDDFRIYNRALTTEEVQEIYEYRDVTTELQTNTIYTNSIIPYDGSRSLQIGDGIEIANSTVVKEGDPVTYATHPIVEFIDTATGILYKYCEFTTDGSITFHEDTECDILMIGGGGAGGYGRAGGGGAGGCICYIGYTFTGGQTYTVEIGAGGVHRTPVQEGVFNSDDFIYHSTQQGGDTNIKNGANTILKAKGGGPGGAANYTGYPGGCFGGRGSQASSANPNYSTNNITYIVEGTNIVKSTNTPITTSKYAIYGTNGGDGYPSWPPLDGLNGGGGGGIGQDGGHATSSKCGKGGDGLYKATINGTEYNFHTHFNITGVLDADNNRYIGGGGGGGGYYDSGYEIIAGGKGGGGSGVDGDTDSGKPHATPGVANTGSGGGGGSMQGGDGGSGFLTIRWRLNTPNPTPTIPYAMTSKGNIWMDSANVVWTSDERIKRKIEDINDEDALNKVLALEPKKYQYRDYLSRGDSEVYGFISQQVKEVIPEATTSVQNFIPNVYQFCNFTNTDEGDSIIQLPDGFDISVLSAELNSTNISRFVKLYNNNNETLCTNYELTNVNNGHGLKTQDLTVFSGNRSNIFVYGTQVDDMTTIDKSYLFTLNVCATQILAQKVQALETTNSELLAKIDALENEILALESS